MNKYKVIKNIDYFNRFVGKGFTLVEVLLYIAISSIIIGVQIVLMNIYSDVYSFSKLNSLVLSEGSQIEMVLSKELRLAKNISITSSTEYSYINSLDEQVTVRQVGGDLEYEINNTITYRLNSSNIEVQNFQILDRTPQTSTKNNYEVTFDLVYKDVSKSIYFSITPLL